MSQTGRFLYNKETSPKLAYMKLKILDFIFVHKGEVFLVFLEIKHKIDLHATYFKLHLNKIKFPTLEISSEWSGGYTSVPHGIFRGIYLCCKV